MIEQKMWREFRDTGLLWFVNTILHTFGWAIVVELNDAEEVTECYPARVKFRGFSEDCNTRGYQKIAQYLKDNVDVLHHETFEK